MPPIDSIADEEEMVTTKNSSDQHTKSREIEKGKEKNAKEEEETASGSHKASRWNSSSVCRAAQ
jgi:protein required for attachment to host cells